MKDRTNQESLDSMPGELPATASRSGLTPAQHGRKLRAAPVDPDALFEQVLDGVEIDGRVFEGFLQSANATFMSEWGLATHLEDLRKVIELVPADARRDRVFLLGHSLGASFAELFAAWRFEDGVRGAELLAGVVLLAYVKLSVALAVLRRGLGGDVLPRSLCAL